MSLIPSATVNVNHFIWEFTGQAAHVMAGYIAISTTRRHTQGHKVLGIVTGVAVAAAAFKEFYWDYHYEDAATRGSSLLDFSMYMVGIALGWFV